MNKYWSLIVAVLCLELLACMAGATPVPTTTPTVTPTPTITPTPTVDPHAVVVLPADIGFFVERSLGRQYGSDFRYRPRYGVTRNTRFYIIFETPKDSGQIYMAVFGVVDGMWEQVDTIQMEGERELGTETRTY